MISRAWLLDNNVITPSQNVWVAYSGGVDSHVLLDLARQCFNNVRAIHINHNLNPDDHKWQNHCQNICDKLNIPLTNITVDATKKSGKSPEDAARNARYLAWHQLLKEDDVLLVAHHADDQAETVLYRLLRGAGPKGLSGIKAISKVGQAILWRPFLNTPKQQLLEYATKNNLDWLQDESNECDKYDRNYIRKHILPIMLQRWPAAVKNINNAAKLCYQLEEFIAPQIKDVLEDVMEIDNQLNLSKFAKHSPQWQQQILRLWLQQQKLMPSSEHIKMILAQVINARIDATPEYVIGNKIVRRSKDRLFLLEPLFEIQQEFCTAWDLKQELSLPNGRVLNITDVSNDQDFIQKLHNFDITVRLGNHGRSAKKIFQQHAIPPWERANYPLIFANDRLACVVGLWCSSRL